MKYQLHTLKSGLKILVVPMPNLESATVAVWVKTGSRYEEKRVNGISHFLEHMVFKGSEKRPSAKEISEAVDAIGGEFNAATSKDWTNFYIKSAVGNLETAFDVLSDMVLHPLLQSEEIEREKGTIIQEIAMYEDTPMMHIGDVFEQLAFSGNALGWDTAGSVASVKGIKREDFIRYRNTHYYPENMLVSVVGGVTAEQALDLAKKYFRDFSGTPETKTTFSEFKKKQEKPQVKLKTKKSDQAHLILGFMADGRGYAGRYAQAILATILGGGMSSRLFIEVRERRGLAYSVRTSPERYQEVGYIGTYAGVNPKKVDEAVSVMLGEHYRLADGTLPISAKELNKAKEYLKGHLALALEATSDVTAFYADQILFREGVESPEEVFRKIDKVMVHEVMAEAKRLFVPSRLNLAIIGNYNNPTRFERLTK
jgi:predicted Zn-dependent peptidase